jgi:hypothetical protein
MFQTITTRYHGPGNVRGARITAKASGGIRKSFPYDHAAGPEGSHLAAAWALAASLNWCGDWHGGALDDKGARVWVKAREGAGNSFKVA